ncbi:hypothetical protein O1L55_02400 [Streptomyces albulus]|nr:hypothetical protein [Streptomyces noursei]
MAPGPTSPSWSSSPSPGRELLIAVQDGRVGCALDGRAPAPTVRVGSDASGSTDDGGTREGGPSAAGRPTSTTAPRPRPLDGGQLRRCRLADQRRHRRHRLQHR